MGAPMTNDLNMSSQDSLQVTAERLRRHYAIFYPWLSDRERNAIDTVRKALQSIAEKNSGR
jgi:hypothetical protein